MPISVSTRITDPKCNATANAHATFWQSTVGRLAGHFEIQHGDNLTCSDAHGLPYNGGFWIVALPRGCRVFESNQGKQIDYAGAENVTAYRGGCSCGHGH